MAYRIRWEGHGVYRRFFGTISASEFLDAYKEMSSDVRFEFVRYIVTDFLEARKNADVDERDAKAFAALERLNFYSAPNIVNAAVATDAEILAHLRYFESLNLSPYPLGIFSTVAEARAWVASNPRRHLQLGLNVARGAPNTARWAGGR